MPEYLVRPVGEDDLTQAIEEAITAWLGQASVTAAVTWPLAGKWRELVERFVAPVSRRLYLAAAADAVDDDKVAQFLAGVVDRLADSTLPADVRAAHAQHGDTVLSPDWAGVDGDSLPWRSRAALIGAHEAQVTAMQATADTAPPGARKRWSSHSDDRTRRSHRAAAGQTVPVNDPFRIGSAHLQYPGDPSGPANEVLRCRCQIYLITQEDSVTAATKPQVKAAVTADLEAPWAPRDAPWDSGEAVLRLHEWASTNDGDVDEDQLARAYLWRPDGPPSDWSLPIADIIDGNLMLIWSAVTSAASTVHDALDLPEDDTAQVRAALDSLYQRAATEFDDKELMTPWQREEAVAAALRAAIIASPDTSEQLMETLASARDDALIAAASARRRSLAASALNDAIEAAPEWRPPVEWFQAPTSEGGPLVSPEGRVAGYVATWRDVDGRPMVHAGYAPNGEVINVPKGGSYGYFHAGNVVLTLDDGSQLHPGVLTTDIGHGDADGSLADQVAHYDNPEATAAAVIVGEDDTGIWMAGAVLPDVLRDEARMARLRLMPVSGHWSETQLGSPMELVAVTAVPHPGFPQRTKSGSWELAASLAAAAGAGGVSLLHELADQMSAASETLRQIIAGAPPTPNADKSTPADKPSDNSTSKKVEGSSAPASPPYPDGVPGELAQAALDAVRDDQAAVTAAAQLADGVVLPLPLQVIADWLADKGDATTHQARGAAVRAAEAICHSDAVEHAGVRMMACRLLSEYKVKRGN